MRALALPLLLAAFVPGPVAAQNEFGDADFEFTMALPEGLHEVSQAERALIMSVTEAQALNIPRSEAPGGRTAHHYFWVDRTSPYNRQMDIHVYDAPPPYRKQEELVDAYTRTGLKVDVTEQMKAPVGGIRIEGTFANQNGVPMRKAVLYMPDFIGGRWAIVHQQCFAGDWAIVKPAFLKSLLTLRFQRQAPPATAKQDGASKQSSTHAGPGAKGGKSSSRAPGATAAVETEAGFGDWQNLQVLGSFALSILLVGHLLLGGRSPR